MLLRVLAICGTSAETKMGSKEEGRCNRKMKSFEIGGWTAYNSSKKAAILDPLIRLLPLRTLQQRRHVACEHHLRTFGWRRCATYGQCIRINYFPRDGLLLRSIELRPIYCTYSRSRRCETRYSLAAGLGARVQRSIVKQRRCIDLTSIAYVVYEIRNVGMQDPGFGVIVLNKKYKNQFWQFAPLCW